MDVRQTSAGRNFTVAIRDAIFEAKADDPLRAVRVIVPSNLAGLSLRRTLGSGMLDPDGDAVPADGASIPAGIAPVPAGIANVSFSTPFQFASLLAAPSLAASGQRPLTTPVLAAAVRHVLATDPGRFGSVAEHVATETALIRAYGEITEMPPTNRRALSSAGSSRTQGLLRFVESVSEHLRTGSSIRFHDEFDVLSAAEAAFAAKPVGEALVLAGPFGQGLAEIDFLAAVMLLAPGAAVFALSGDVSVDDATRLQAEHICHVSLESVHVDLPVPAHLVPTADPDEEVRAVVREILAKADTGVRFDQMAVFVPVRAPYLRSIREQFLQAGIPSAGPEHRTLGDSMVGRLLLRLLHLADSAFSAAHDKRFDRDGVLSLVEAAPLRGPDGRRIRSGPWENISRSAGVVAGIDDWTNRLGAHEASLVKRVDDNRSEISDGALSGFERERSAAGELRLFVTWLAELTDPKQVGRSWSDRSSWARQTLAALLPTENRRTSWPPTEVDAADRVDKMLARVAVLDEIEPNLTSASFLRAIQLELDVPAGRRGRFGSGVLVTPLASAVGLDLAEVFIVGLAEGVCPRPIREDTLLPDSERALAGGGLPSRSDRNRDERQSFLHAVASGSSSCTLVLPRGDHRSGRERTASRWWVEAVRARTGDLSVNSQNWADSQLFVDTKLGSFQQSLSTAIERGIVSSPSDLQLHHVHAAHLAGVTLDLDELTPALRRGIDLATTRLAGYNRFTGDLSAIEVPRVIADDKAISPSRLESWAKCPRRYFFEQLLRLGEIDRPEEIAEISAMDKGNLFHQILEDFIGESLPEKAHALSDPDYVWTDADRARLSAIADVRYDEYESLGRTGRPILWAIKREETNADLDAFLRSDDEMRTDRRSLPEHVEMAFGLPDRSGGEEQPAAEVSLQDGRTVRLRGFIDRLDVRTTDGTPIVHDYKTGSSRNQEQRNFDQDPILGGTKLQLGVYAEAARQRFGTDRAEAYYWFTSAKGRFKRSGYEWTPDRKDRFVGAVQTIVDGIERGDFPPNPGEVGYFGFQNCGFCPFNRICPADRDTELEVAIRTGNLVDYVQMHLPPEPEVDSTDGSGS